MRFREIWWVVAHQADGKIAFLKAECGSLSEATRVIEALKRDEPRYRYQLLQIQ